jgi:hypothetical protein
LAYVAAIGARPAAAHVLACLSRPAMTSSAFGSIDPVEGLGPLIDTWLPPFEDWSPLIAACMDKGPFAETGVGTIAWTGSLMLPRGGAISQLSRRAYFPRIVPFPSLVARSAIMRVDVGNALAH